ncbi:glycosyltransferase family 1 protein [Fusobacterium sp.]|uniref:glycosyltransferase family 4 protein n=1 Tax=Fusobacterium sp. TaxID=68766 RepID=UPI0025BF1CE8|nr:glycosyltransferase family 1 protein [Fusobacterium sp.]
MKKIVINGRFLTQQITGVQRVAHELVRELDDLVKIEQLEVVILAPKNILFENLYKNITIKKIGFLKGHLWEQLELPLYTFFEKGLLINFGSTAPIINTGIVDIHDISFRVNPEFFSKKFSWYYRILIWILVRTSRKILTVSEFSKKEIIKYYGVYEEKIKVVYNSWEHILRIKEDMSILKKFNLQKKNFYLAVSSIAPNKNFKYIVELAKLYPEKQFAIVGKKNTEVFGDLGIDNIENLVWCGYVSDEELKGLYMTCRGFIFPSFYEGFGLPPLEAMGCGCEEIYVSNTSCLPEIFEDSVYYLNPNKVEKILDLKEIKTNILEKYSWRKSTDKLLEINKERGY